MAFRHRFGKRSLARLATVVPELREICFAAIEITPFDLICLCGVRNREEQERAFHEGRSQVHWPHGNHNTTEPDGLARAVDLAPYPIDWHDRPRFVYLAGVMQALAHARALRLRWGGNWDGDGTLITDQRLVDLPHYEVLP